MSACKRIKKNNRAQGAEQMPDYVKAAGIHVAYTKQ